MQFTRVVLTNRKERFPMGAHIVNFGTEAVEIELIPEVEPLLSTGKAVIRREGGGYEVETLFGAQCKLFRVKCRGTLDTPEDGLVFGQILIAEAVCACERRFVYGSLNDLTEVVRVGGGTIRAFDAHFKIPGVRAIYRKSFVAGCMVINNIVIRGVFKTIQNFTSFEGVNMTSKTAEEGMILLRDEMGKSNKVF